MSNEELFILLRGILWFNPSIPVVNDEEIAGFIDYCRDKELFLTVHQNQQQIKEELQKYKTLEKQFDCPLDIIVKICKGKKIICEGDSGQYYGSLRWNIYSKEFVFDLSTEYERTDSFIRLSEYNKTWWLEGEK